MAGYRQIHTKMWKDPWFIDLDADYKLLFIYLFSNERAVLTGLYDISLKVVAFETGISMDRVISGLQAFKEASKAFYDEGWIWVPNLVLYNAGNISSKKVRAHIEGLIAETPDMELKRLWIGYFNEVIAPQYSIDTLCIPYAYPRPHEHEHEHQQEQEHEHQQDPEPAPENPAADAVAADFGNGKAHKYTIPADPERLQQLDRVEITEPTRSEIAQLPHATPEYLAAWAEWFEAQDRFGPGWLVTQLRQGLDPPREPATAVRRYLGGAYAEFIQH